MKRTIKEKKVLKKLGIPDFRHMTKDKIIKFATMLPYMDPLVAKAALEQFPEFKDMACNIIFQFKESMDTALQHNDKSQDEFYLTCNRIIDSLEKELEKENISSEERDRIEDKMIMIAKMKGEKDTENKKFISRILLGGAGLATFFGVAAASLLGGNSQASVNENDMIEDDEDSKGEINDDIIDV
ncbi:hypothetical protein [uncultured Ruminococcus sp.]|uniref:hypothetical protein n=1 Tax=uncultured Ruminococcus sp. TaxID=165186 RepID=UPI0026329661|nr:hypothetical protein [uncultured Ruminococcus sp.]